MTGDTRDVAGSIESLVHVTEDRVAGDGALDDDGRSAPTEDCPPGGGIR